MKHFIYEDIENEKVYDIFQKTEKNEEPKHCDGCEKPIKKGMYFVESDGGDAYCVKCSTTDY